VHAKETERLRGVWEVTKLFSSQRLVLDMNKDILFLHFGIKFIIYCNNETMCPNPSGKTSLGRGVLHLDRSSRSL
jgi:hypothetical protein